LNAGEIDLGEGSNTLEGSASATSTQRQSLTLINAGLAVGLLNANPIGDGATIVSVGSGGTQKLTGKAKASLADVDLSAELVAGAAAVGIANGIDSEIDLENGNAIITGTATATATHVNAAGLGIGLAAGILNGGTIKTGSSNDVITGSGSGSIADSSLDLFAGIANFGGISTGAGTDTVDALVGGFTGDGLVDLGDDNDTLKGFGSGFFDGGAGTDLLTLNTVVVGSPVTYNVSELDGSIYHISLGGVEMDVTNFENITTATGVFALSTFAGSTVNV
jgi:hypothetical protein